MPSSTSCIIFSKNFIDAMLRSTTPVVLDFDKLDTYKDFAYVLLAKKLLYVM
jgi:hypothetical protein